MRVSPDRGNRQQQAGREPAGIVDPVLRRDRTPLGRTRVIEGGDPRQGFSLAGQVRVRTVWRAQVELRELLVERLVLAERQRQRRPQRHPFGAEERELLAAAVDNATEG